ncbi:S38A2 protein, partial [Atractosteus spatula]|nr:S38A2 protein [Atractosteus spatula]
MKQGVTKTEMSQFNISPDEDSSCSSNSNEYGYPDCPVKKVPISSQYQDMDPESQNFLPDHHLGKKKYETEYHAGTTSFGMSVFNLGNAIMGSGILGLSYAMANTGIALFVILLVAVSIFSLYSVHLLLKTANEGGSLVYEQLGYKAFGMPGKLAASCSITMQNIGAMSSYLYIVKYELPIVIQAFLGMKENTGEWYINGDYLVLLVSVVIILPLSLTRNLGYLGYTSGFSLLCMVFFLIVVIYKKFQIPCPLPLEHDAVNMTLNHTLSHLSAEIHRRAENATVYQEDACTPKYFVFNSQFKDPNFNGYFSNHSFFNQLNMYEFCYFFSILTVFLRCLFSFAQLVLHSLQLKLNMKNISFLYSRSRKRMQNVSNVSFFSMFVMYLLAALFGYLTFSDNVEPELLHTYSKVYKFDVVLLVVRLAVLTAVTLTVPVVLFPIRTSVNQLLCASKEFSWIRHTIITFLLLSGTNALVIFVPTIRDIFGFIGASAAAMLIFILPSAFYIKLVKKESMKSVQKIGASIFLISGFFVMLGSMTLIILDWIHNTAGQADGH